MAYEHMLIRASQKMEDTEWRLNGLSTEGWELVAVAAYADGVRDTLYLRRPTSPKVSVGEG